MERGGALGAALPAVCSISRVGAAPRIISQKDSEKEDIFRTIYG